MYVYVMPYVTLYEQLFFMAYDLPLFTLLQLHVYDSIVNDSDITSDRMR